MTNIVAVTALIMTTVSTNWTIMAPSTYIDWTGTNRFQMQTGILVTNVTASLPWKGTTLEVILEEERGPVLTDEKRLIPIGATTNLPQLIHFNTTLLPPTPKAPPPLPLGIRNRQ